MTGATKRQQRQPRESITPAARRVVKRLEPHAVPGSVRVTSGGIGHETVEARIGNDLLTVRIQRGEVSSHHTKRHDAQDDPVTDYYPGVYWDSLASAISHCLPAQRAWVTDPCGLKGRIEVLIYHQGVSIKPVAYFRLQLDAIGWDRPLRKFKEGRALHLCQELIRTEGKDLGCVAAMLDWLEEFHPEEGERIQTARQRQTVRD